MPKLGDFRRKIVSRTACPDRLAIAFGTQRIARLKHQMREYPVKGGPVVKSLAGKLLKIGDGPGSRIFIKLDHHPSQGFLGPKLDIEHRDIIGQGGTGETGNSDQGEN